MMLGQGSKECVETEPPRISRRSMAGWLLSLVLAASIAARGQAPELVPQMGGNLESGLSGGSITFGASGKWVATGDQSGTLLIFDLESGRIARSISVPGAITGLVAHPSRDWLAILTGQRGADAGGGSITLLDIATGRELWRTSASCSAVQFMGRGATLAGICRKDAASSPTQRPEQSLKEWTAETGKASEAGWLPRDLPRDLFLGGAMSEDGRFVTAGKVLGFKAILHHGTRSFPVEQLVLDSQTGQIVGTLNGIMMGLSARAHTALTITPEAEVLADIYSGKQLAVLSGPMQNDPLAFMSAKVSADGSRFLLVGLSGMAIMDAATGRLDRITAKDLPYSFSAALAPDNDQLAVAQGGAVMLLRISKPDERRTLGSASTVMLPGTEFMKLAGAATPPARTTMSKKEQQALIREYEKKIDKAKGAEKQRLTTELDHLLNGNPAATEQAQKEAGLEAENSLLQYDGKFGAMVAVPAMPAFLDGGRLLALRSADGGWDIWDVATGNRIPFHKPPDHLEPYSRGGHDPGVLLDEEDLREIEVSLGAHPAPASPTVKASNDLRVEVACASSGQAHVLELIRDDRDYKKLRSAVLRHADGSSADLLTKGIDLSGLRRPTDAEAEMQQAMRRETPQICSLSPDGRRLVVEGLRPELKAERKHEAGRVSFMSKESIYGRVLADSLVVYNTEDGQKVCELENTAAPALFDVLPGELTFSPDGSRIMGGGDEDSTGYGLRHRTLRTWDAATCRQLSSVAGTVAGILGYSPDQRQYFTALGVPQMGQANFGVRVWDASALKPLFDLPDAMAGDQAITVTPNGKVLVGPDRHNALGLWDRQTGKRLGTMRPLQEGEWLVTTPAGLFDGSPRGWKEIAWRDGEGTLATRPGEIFFNEFYRPGLLAELLEGHVPEPPRTIAQVDRRQPTITLTADASASAARTIAVHLALSEAPATPGGAHAGGVRDVRLFRNGTMIQAWRGDLELRDGTLALETKVTLVAGENRLVAYAFNRDNVKSADAVFMVRGEAAARRGTAYILAVGVNRYANGEFNLRYAVPDAQRFAEVLAAKQAALASVARVVEVSLLDDQATKSNLMLALALLGGRRAPGTLPADAATLLGRLREVEPEDTVVVYFAGHGVAWRDHFYLVPHDLGYDGPRAGVGKALDRMLANSISDLELEHAFEPMDAGHLLLVIDACNSGRALDAEEQRRGPMNSKGLAQLAYEKGMYVLTAAQAYQSALESARLGHGYLTYALVEEGLARAEADTRPRDGQVTASEWFEYAARRVPELQIKALEESFAAGRELTFESAPAGDAEQKIGHAPAIRGRLQTPRFYYRRDPSSVDTVVARTP